jgi:hypothetical protein
MRQRFRTGLAVAAMVILAGFWPSPAGADEDVTTVVGSVTWVSQDAVEVAGQRGILSSATDVRSDHHPVSRASIRVGMPASMEIDSGGRVLELRVTGVVE